MKTFNEKLNKLTEEVERFFIEQKPTYLKKNNPDDEVWEYSDIGDVIGIKNGQLLFDDENEEKMLPITAWADYITFGSLCTLATSCQLQFKNKK